jgi:hypothetical protein
MTTQLEKLKQWSEETEIKLDRFYAIEILSDQFKLYGYFNNDITEKLYNLKFDCTLMTTGSIRLSNNNTIIYLS